MERQVRRRRPRAGLRMLLAGVVAGLCCGCFVLDELDEGQEIMRQVSPGGGKKVAAEEPAPSSADRAGQQSAFAGMLDTARSWWHKATAPAPAEHDPNDGLVRCRVGGGMQYMRASDCQIRGGKSRGGKSAS